MACPEPQPVLSAVTEHAIFLVLTVPSGSEERVRNRVAELVDLTKSVGFRAPQGALSCVVGLGAGLWDRSVEGPRPAQLRPFKEVVGARRTAVATPGDLLFHIRANRFDLCFELGQRLLAGLEKYVRVVDEVHGSRFFDGRDLLGFVDGTANPTGATAAHAVLIGQEDPLFCGGTYVVVQRYVHDLERWNALAIEQQEGAIGRTKLDDIELPGHIKPLNSHVALTTITDGSGNEREIVRYNMPFGRLGTAEFGTYFVGYARNPDVIQQMLTNMFVGSPPGNYDRILDFSTPMTGNLFFVPDAGRLARLGVDRPRQEATTAAAPSGADDGSLSIGSLRGASR